MKTVSLILIAVLGLYFVFEIIKQIRKDKKLILKNIKVPLIGIVLALLLFDTVLNR